MGMGPSRSPIRGVDGGLMEDGIELKKYRFVIQFVWIPKTPGAAELVAESESGDY